jgi:hypothetical protein
MFAVTQALMFAAKLFERNKEYDTVAFANFSPEE